MAIQAAEISAILKEQIKNFGQEAEVAEVGRVLSVGDGIARVRFTVWPSLISRSLPKITMPTLSVSRLSAMPRTPFSNSTISPACTLSSP